MSERWMWARMSEKPQSENFSNESCFLRFPGRRHGKVQSVKRLILLLSTLFVGIRKEKWAVSGVFATKTLTRRSRRRKVGSTRKWVFKIKQWMKCQPAWMSEERWRKISILIFPSITEEQSAREVRSSERWRHRTWILSVGIKGKHRDYRVFLVCWCYRDWILRARKQARRGESEPENRYRFYTFVIVFVSICSASVVLSNSSCRIESVFHLSLVVVLCFIAEVRVCERREKQKRERECAPSAIRRGSF